MADDFERALVITFDYTSAVDAQLKARAVSFIAEVKKNPDVWRLAIERFNISTHLEIRFWCLQTLHEVVKSSYGSFPEASRAEVKTALLTWLQRDCAPSLKSGGGLPHFLRNKLAQTMVAVLQFEYPATWPRFFQDLIGAMRSLGDGLVDMFCRILISVDEDLVSLDIPRSQDESKLSMHFKDSMREHSIADVAAAWYDLLEAYGTRGGAGIEIATNVLQTMQRYIPWIDIGLVANGRFVGLLMAIMDSSPSAALRGAVADCLMEIVSKRMDSVPKLTLIQSMGIVPRCATWANGFPLPPRRGAQQGGGGGEEGEDEGEDEDVQQMLVVRLARLLATLATEVIDSLKRLENQVISFNAMGLSVGDEAAEEVQVASSLGSQQMQALFPALLSAFHSGLDDVALPLMPFMHTYIARLKVQLKRMAGPAHPAPHPQPGGGQGGQAAAAAAAAPPPTLPPEQLGHIRAILEGIAATARYPEPSACAWQDGEGAGPGRGGRPNMSPSEIAAAKEEQQDVEEKRRELFTLFRNISKLAFGETLSFVAGLFQKVTSSINGNATASQAAASPSSPTSTRPPSAAPPASFQDVEVAVSLLYELGEGAPEEALKPDGGALGALAAALMQAPLPAARHRLVALAVLETYVRFFRIMQTHPQVAPSAIAAFLDERGIGHCTEDVAARACYLFCRLVKSLRSSLRPLAPSILQSLQPHLVRIATRPLMDLPSSGAGSSAGGGGTAQRDGSGGKPPNAAVVDDRLYVFEAVGLLLGQDEIPVEQQAALLGSLLQPLKEQMEGNLMAAMAATTQGGGGGGGTMAAAAAAPGLILQALEAIVRLNKGFRPDTLTRTRPQLGAMFLTCMDVAVRIPPAFPSHRLLRSRFISSVHRLVEGLGASMLPYLPPALEALVLSGGGANPLAAASSSSTGSFSAASDLCEVLSLSNQLVLKFKEQVAGLLLVLLPVLATRIYQILGSDWDWSGRRAAPLPLSSVSSIGGGSGASGGGARSAAANAVAATLEEARERGELQRAFYSLLHVVMHSGLSGTLLKMAPLASQATTPSGGVSGVGGGGGEAAMLDAIIRGVVTGGATHVDATVRRTCLQILERLVGDWCPVVMVPSAGEAAAAAGGAGGGAVAAGAQQPPPPQRQMGEEAVPGFRRFAVEAFAGEVCILGLFRGGGEGDGGAALATPSLAAAGGGPSCHPQASASSSSSSSLSILMDPRDAATSSLLGEAAVLLKLVATHCCLGGGAELAGNLLAGALPASGLPVELQHQIAVCLRDGEAKEVKEGLRASLEWKVTTTTIR